VRASDGEFEDSEVVKLYVGLAGEPLAPNGLPVSLTNWAPSIVEVLASSGSGLATVRWASAESVAYTLYYSDSPFGGP